MWHYLQFAMGLAQLGHDVYYLEDSCFFEGDEQPWFYDPIAKCMSINPSNNLQFAKDIIEKVGLEDRWALFDAQEAHWRGPAQDRVLDLCASADLLLNVSAANPLRGPLTQIPVRAFIDTDPVFSQVRILTNPIRRDLAKQHNCFFTFGENIASRQSNAPDDGFPWQATRQPVVLDAWPVTPGPKRGHFTTLMAWDSFKKEEYAGVRYGMKSDSFGEFLNFPKMVNAPVELGLFDPSAAPETLQTQGWSVCDAKPKTNDPWTYQSYIRESKAEFSVAKHGYVSTRSGWFSDRSATYMASGRPVLVQETGFSDWLPTGLGVLPFNTLEEAVAGADDIDRRYEIHCQAARALAEEYFDSRKVLARLIECAQRSVGSPGVIPLPGPI